MSEKFARRGCVRLPQHLWENKTPEVEEAFKDFIYETSNTPPPGAGV